MLTLAWKCRRRSTVSMHLDPTETVVSCKDNAQWGLPVLIVDEDNNEDYQSSLFYLFFMDSSWEQRCTLDFLILDFSSAIQTIQPIIISQCQILILILDWLKLEFFFCFFLTVRGKQCLFPQGVSCLLHWTFCTQMTAGTNTRRGISTVLSVCSRKERWSPIWS